MATLFFQATCVRLQRNVSSIILYRRDLLTTLREISRIISQKQDDNNFSMSDKYSVASPVIEQCLR